jgi:beta-glucanase (GH16 family)
MLCVLIQIIVTGTVLDVFATGKNDCNGSFTMRYLLGVMFLLFFLFYASAGWELVWNDEFDYTGLPDKTKWDYDVGTGSGGWGNNELQYYMKESLKNAHVENGVLVLTAHKERMEQCDYTSTRIVTRDKGDWIYGRFEIAAKLPKGRGLWPAIWMLPTEWVYKEWPKSGELDIMENVGFDPYTIHFNIHTEEYNHLIKTNKGDTLKLSDPHTKFNVYALEWYKDSVVFYANDRKAFVFRNEHTGYKTWPFDQKFHLLLNIAVGGEWGGQQGIDTAVFPASMEIDYVRVFKKSTSSVIGKAKRIFRTSEPLISMSDRKLIIHRPSVTAVKIFTAKGTQVYDLLIQFSMAKHTIPLSLQKGIYIAVVNEGKKRSIENIVSIQ